MLGEQEQRERFSYALQKAIAKRGVSRRSLAATVGVDARTLAKWERGESLPNLYESQRLALALGVDERLFKNPPEVPPPPPEPYYPLDEYLLEAGRAGADEGHRRATTHRPSPNPGTPTRTPGRRARASGE